MRVRDEGDKTRGGGRQGGGRGGGRRETISLTEIKEVLISSGTLFGLHSGDVKRPLIR